MKKKLRITLLTIIMCTRLVPLYGQVTSDKIVFFNEFYSNYIKKAASNKNTDSIYKETIQTTICHKYFQKSEYADIVTGFFATPIRNTDELTRSINRITVNQEKIKAKINGALKKCREYITNDSVTIYVMPVNFDNRMVIESMKGIIGLTAGSRQIILTIEPDILGWEDMLDYAVSHEFHHAYWTKVNFGKSNKWTLLDYLVFEGKGDFFAHMLYPNVIAPWTMSLAEDQRLDLWTKIKPSLQSEDISYQMEVMFGSRNYPIWGGYTIGYDIVLTALNNKKLTPESWTNLESDRILEQSAYK